MERDPEHPIIDCPGQYRIAQLHLDAGLEGGEPYLDLVLVRENERKTLRFLSPQNLQIERGFPEPTTGMVILDVRRRQLDGLAVWVTDFEASSGKIEFWAREVVDLDL